jgi:hypothetical protein
MIRHTLSLFAGMAFFSLSLCAADFAWQEPHATVLPTGELEYAPRPFEFKSGSSLRYIDYEAGNDANPGSRKEPWKHHPWDPDAAGNAKAAANGIHTYVFRGGVTYRGNLMVPPEATGEAGNPIRLTRDPSWGRGPAVLNGAEVVSGWTQQAHAKMPEADNVWAAEVNFLTRTLWLTRPDGAPVRLKLARWPNWNEPNERDLMSEWPTWDQPQWWKVGLNQTKIGNETKHVGIAESLPEPLEDLVGGTVWSEWGIVMGSPYPASIEGVADIQQGNRTYRGIAFRGPWTYNALERIITGNRFYLEDLPQFLDEPGEFWVEKLGNSRSRIYVRLPNDANPNAFTLEAGRHYNHIEASHLEHVEISGLTFRFGNMGWDYNHPQWGRPNLQIGAIRLTGRGDGIVIANNTFEHLPMPIRVEVGSPTQAIGTIAVNDNVMTDTDHGAITITNSTPRNESAMGSLGHVDVLRNRLERIGMRIISGEHGHAVDIRYPETSHLAGNFLYRIGGWGLAVFGGKPAGAARAGVEAPLSRHLIHHNRVEDVLLKSNDWGGIETWQGGSHYVFNNIVINALGYKNWVFAQGNKDKASSFGHAYYMDGSFKNYLFNNIGLGQNNDVATPGVNLTAIQNIISFENWYFNNSFHRFVAATRQQAPDAGRFRYLGNVFSDVSDMLFRHANPKDAEPDPNASHYTQGGSFDYPTIAYDGNILFDISGTMGTFEETGVVYRDLAGFSGALENVKAQADSVGSVAPVPPLRDPDAMDWRPVPQSAVQDNGVLVFVPWGLAMTIGEWHFTRNRANPNEIIDEHWLMTATYGDRKQYKDTQRFPLIGEELTAENYVTSPFETWTEGALRLDGSQRLTVAHETLPTHEPVEEQSDTTTTELAFGTVTSPSEIIMGTDLVTEIELKEGIDPSHLQLHMHWLRSAGWGGFAELGGRPEHLGGRRYRFTVPTEPRNDAAFFNLMFFLSPDGEWKNKTANAGVRVPIGEGVVVADAEPRSVNAADTSLIVEAIVRPRGDGVIAQKFDGNTGYILEIRDGAPTFRISTDGGDDLSVKAAPLEADRWHHLLAEFDRARNRLTLHVPGTPGITAGLERFSGSLSNKADFIVGENFNGDLDFLRVALSSLEESGTTFDELHSWQTDGPQYRDFSGNDRRLHNAAGAVIK